MNGRNGENATATKHGCESLADYDRLRDRFSARNYLKIDPVSHIEGKPSSSAPISSRPRRMTARAITSESSRTLPGQR